MALKRLFPFQLAQSGAALNNVLSWDGTKWIPAALSAIGGISIYTGSGTIGAGVAASTTNATLPTGNSAFNLRYSNAVNAIEINNASGVGNMQLNSGSIGQAYAQFLSTSLVLAYGANTNIMTETESTFSAPVLISLATGSLDPKAAVDITAVDKGLLLPRLTGAEFTAFSAAGGGVTADGMILYNTSSDTIKLRSNGAWVDLADAAGGILTASNGLTKTGTNVTLGGALTQNTNITNANTYQLSVTGSRTGDYIFSATNTGTGATDSVISAVASAGVGLFGKSALSGLGGLFTTEDVGGFTIPALKVTRNVTSGAGTTGTGVQLSFGIETSTTVDTLSNNITSEWTTATHANRTSKLSISTVNSGTEATKLELAGTGQLTLNSYGAGAFTGTAAKTLQVTASGLVIEGSVNPAVGTGGIYGGSGNIPNGTVATVANGGTFTFDYNGGNDAILISDSATGITAKSKDGTKTVQVVNANILMTSGGISFKIDGGGLLGTSSPLLIDYTGSGSSNNSGLELRATDKVFYPSRLTTTQRDALTPTMTNGGEIYNSTTNKFNFFENNAWVGYMVDTAGVGGIYKGSGTIAAAAVATVTGSSTFKIAYSTGGNGAITVSSTSGSENVVVGGTTTSYGRLTVSNSQATLLAGTSGQGITVAEGLSVFSSNTHQIGKKVLFTAVNTPATFGVQQNDYDIGNNTHIRLETTVNDTIISGMTHGFGLGNFGDAEGRIVYLTNIGATNNIRLAGNNAGSQSEYRFITLVVLAPGNTVQFIYDATSQRWRNVV